MSAFKNRLKSKIAHRIRKYLCSTAYARSLSTKPREYVGVIGLEIHAQILSKSKLFSGAVSSFGGAPNSQVALFDAAYPGTLPSLNKRCVDAGVLTALAFGCKVNKVSKFDRKHYFYADLPAGYQITQQRYPLAGKGVFTFDMLNMQSNIIKQKTVNIVQIQLEQDSGKSLHDEEDKESYIDLNRAGIGLMEIITAPDFSSGEEAAYFVKEVQTLLSTIGVCCGKLNEGAMRVDANISVHHPGDPLGERTEIKNLNTIRNITRAIDFEIKRQISDLKNGKKIVNETRSFDISNGETIPMRDKEIELDYRFIPEPNLPPLHIYDNTCLPDGLDDSQVVNIDSLANSLPLLPHQKRKMYAEKYFLSPAAAYILVMKDGFETVFTSCINDSSRNPTDVFNFIQSIYLRAMSLREQDIADSEVPVKMFLKLYDVFHKNKITRHNAEKVMDIMLDNPSVDPLEYITENNLWVNNSVEHITEVIQQVMIENSDLVQKWEESVKKKAFFGDKLRKVIFDVLGDKANPKIISTILRGIVRKHKNYEEDYQASQEQKLRKSKKKKKL